MNSLLKEYKDKTPLYVNSLKDYAFYCTNYDLLDSEGNLIFQDRDTSCFKKIFLEEYPESDYLKFNKGQTLRVYALSNHTRLSENEIKRYIRLLRSLNIPFKFKIVNDLDLNKEKFVKQDGRVVCFERQKVYVLEIKLDGINFTQLKFLVYHFRYIYEMNSDLVIRDSLKYKKRFKNYSIFQIISFMDYKYRKKVSGYLGHRVFNRMHLNVTLPKIKSCLMNSDSLEEFSRNFKHYTRFGNYIWGEVEQQDRLPVFDDKISIGKFCNRIKKIKEVKLINNG